jgi:hypothetical protein
MLNILKNNQLIIGIIIGVIITSLNFNILGSLFEMIQIIGYFLAVLYLINFTLIEILINNNKETSSLQILEINYNKNMRNIKITMVNNNLLEGEELFKGIYTTLIENKDFLNFGYQKIIILSVVLLSESEHNLHSNILINNDTPFEEYYSTICHELDKYNKLQYGYHNEVISRYVVLAWNVDNAKNLKIKQTYTANKLKKFPSNNLGQIRKYSSLKNKT